jgi:hypothetical protein
MGAPQATRPGLGGWGEGGVITQLYIYTVYMYIPQPINMQKRCGRVQGLLQQFSKG